LQVFTEDELDILEYREDLEHYWQDGHGHSLNGDSACVLTFNMAQNFKNVSEANSDNEEEELGIFYFSHSGAVLKLMAHLGLFKDDEHLRHNNYQQMKTRKWRTSEIDPFGANVALVLRRCFENDFSVGLLVNEKWTSIPGCQQWCPLNTFLERFGSSERCRVKELCAVSEEERASIAADVREDKF